MQPPEEGKGVAHQERGRSDHPGLALIRQVPGPGVERNTREPERDTLLEHAASRPLLGANRGLLLGGPLDFFRAPLGGKAEQGFRHNLIGA